MEPGVTRPEPVASSTVADQATRSGSDAARPSAPAVALVAEMLRLQGLAGNRAVRDLAARDGAGGPVAQRQSAPRDPARDTIADELRSVDHSLDAALEDLRDAAADQAREIAPEVLEEWAGETRRGLGRLAGLLGHVNSLYGHGRDISDLVAFADAVNAFDQALQESSHGSGADLRAAGNALSALGDATATALGAIPLPEALLPLRVQLQAVIRNAASIGNVGIGVFGGYVDRLESVADEADRARGRGFRGQGVNALQAASLRFHLGDDYIPLSEEAERVVPRITAQGDGLVSDLRTHIEGTTRPAWLGGVRADLAGEEQADALANLDRVADQLRRAAERVAGDIVGRNELLYLIKAARGAVANEASRQAMLGQLNPRMSDDPAYITGHLLARGTIQGVATPEDVGFRLH